MCACVLSLTDSVQCTYFHIMYVRMPLQLVVSVPTFAFLFHSFMPRTLRLPSGVTPLVSTAHPLYHIASSYVLSYIQAYTYII